MRLPNVFRLGVVAICHGGRALISNALALARVWYMATLLPIPGWALGKLNRIIFPFFWKGKKDLVARTVLIQSRSCGGFGIVAAHLKSQALLLQWVKRFRAASYGWRLFLVYWTQSVFRASPAEVLASPFCFDIKRLPPFYAALLHAWRAVNGHSSADLSHLFIGGPTAQVPVSNISCKSCYDLVLGANRRNPHCELKFRPFFGTLYWPATWKCKIRTKITRKIKRSKQSHSYYSNSVATDRLVLAGDVETNPGPDDAKTRRKK